MNIELTIKSLKKSGIAWVARLPDGTPWLAERASAVELHQTVALQAMEALKAESDRFHRDLVDAGWTAEEIVTAKEQEWLHDCEEAIR
jgi:hypothetical protein